KESANYRFINSVFIDPNYQQKLLSIGNTSGATREAITKSQLEELEINLPSLSLQNEYAKHIELIEAQKSSLQKGLEKLEMNYKALMQIYFNSDS
ncbi:MAG: hypothetical protein PHV39_09055, partial [Methanomicrobium sp.]|nr:hypothetical protein [Methanomicrobium sp.]